MEYKIDKEGRVAFRGRLGPIRPEPGRKYYNHMATHSPGEWHRHWLLTSGQYIKTSNPDMRKGYGWAVVGESGPELVNFRSRGHGYQSPHSPDCRDRNCRKCDGQAWDDTTDALASCGCTCHLEPTH